MPLDVFVRLTLSLDDMIVSGDGFVFPGLTGGKWTAPGGGIGECLVRIMVH